MLLLFFVLLSGNLVCADETATEKDSLTTYWLNEIVVSGERLPLITTTTMHRIQSQKIERLDVSDPSQALRFIPGLHMTKNSKGEAGFQLRGYGQRQISVFLDGIPISLPYDGKLDVSQLVGDRLQSIRVARGTGSALYGTNTLGGSVNILTTSPANTTRVNWRLEGSDHGRYFSSIYANHRVGKLSFNLDVAWEKADEFKLSHNFTPTINEDGGRRENSACDKLSGRFKMQYQINQKHTLGLNYSRIDNRQEVPVDSRSGRPRFWRFPEWRKNIVSLNSRHVLTDFMALRSVFYYDNYYNLLRSYSDASFDTVRWKSTYDDHSLGGMIYPSLDLLPFGTTNGILAIKQDVHREEFRNFGFDRYAMVTWTTGLEQDIRIDKRNTLVAGFDFNYLKPTEAAESDLRDAIFLTNGQIAWKYKQRPSLQLHVAIGKKSRFPTLKELYSERLGRTVPNPQLSEEHAYNSEIGLRYQQKHNYIQAVVFHNRMRDLIEVRQLGDEQMQMQNIGKAGITGFEVDFNWRLQPFDLYANYTYMDAQNQSDNRDSDYLAYRPDHLFKGTALWRITRHWHCMAETEAASGQHYQNPQNLQWEALNDYLILNAKMRYRLVNGMHVYLRANNLLDEAYSSEYGVPMPGREIVAGWRIDVM